jgi:RNA polymerase sigma-70 factor (ECF subfamily)
MAASTSTHPEQTWISMKRASNWDDIRVAKIIARGDEAAFSDFYDRFSPRLFALARRLSGDSSLAEDMTQEVFLHLLRKIHLYNGQASLGTWLYRVATNFYISFLRSHKPKRFNVETREPADMPEPEKISPPGDRVQHKLDLESGLDRLSHGYRTVLIMHDVMGFKHEEIAQTLEISPGTSKSQLHHARMKMRKLLRGDDTDAK